LIDYKIINSSTDIPDDFIEVFIIGKKYITVPVLGMTYNHVVYVGKRWHK
jgi:hypothetical protein